MDQKTTTMQMLTEEKERVNALRAELEQTKSSLSEAEKKKQEATFLWEAEVKSRSGYMKVF